MAKKIKDKTVEEIPIYRTELECEYIEPKVIEVSLRGKYLPNILVKLGEFANNAEARRHIRNIGLVVDNNLINDIDYQIRQFNLIEIHGTIYNVRII